MKVSLVRLFFLRSIRVRDGLLRPVLLSAWILGLLLAVLLANPASAQSTSQSCTPGPHSGTIASNQTWCASDSPHMVTGSVTINSSVTLTIEPGVVVRFATGLYMDIRGTLIAEGVEGSEILITSNAASPAAGDWVGLQLSGGLPPAWITWKLLMLVRLIAGGFLCFPHQIYR